MQREFSKELAEDRQFEIGGELFEWAYPHWEVGAKLWDGDDRQEEAEGGETNGKTAFSFRADTEFAIKNVPLFLDPKNDSHKRWKTLVARKTDPVPRHQIIQLYRWLFEQVGGLPTKPASDSESGAGDSEESSEEESS
jgi:hypothetical protein